MTDNILVSEHATQGICVIPSPCQMSDKTYVWCQNLQHTFIFGEIGDFRVGLEIVSENKESVSLLELMSFSMIQRSSNKASKSTSPLPVNIQRFSYQCFTLTLINY